jgi:sulfopyruvate decarboxylase subunit beta
MAMKPEAVLRAIAAVRGDAICVPTMTTAPAWRDIAPDDLSVTCVGFMGGASALGLGLALACPDRKVLVLDGDGSLLMQLGSLATIAGARPRNLVHFVFKNGVYHTSGSQEIPGGLTVDFVTMAKGAGYRGAWTIGELEDFQRRLPSLLAAEGPVLVELVTGLADKTPMTARGGKPFHEQVEALRGKLTAA